MADPVVNFGKVTLSAGYASGVTSVALVSGDGAKLPNPTTDGAFNLVWYNSTDYPDPSDDPLVEIVRVTAKSGDTLTITRGQEGTGDNNHNTSGKTYKMILPLTKKTYDELVAGAWVSSTATSIQLARNTNYLLTGTSLQTVTLPTTANVGDYIEIRGHGTGLFKIAQNANQKIYFGNLASALGTGGYVASNTVGDSIRLECVVANNEWRVVSASGSSYDIV